jgi:flagellar biosynthesis/type III secretory pathway chaperone
MHKPESIALFERLIEQEINCAKRLSEALSVERAALSKAMSDPQSLDQASRAKSALLEEMEQRVAAHEGFLASRRLAPGKQGTENYLRGAPGDARAHGLWRQLQEIAGACQQANEINGNIILLSQARLQRALDTLRGKQDTAKTYGRGGQTRSAAHSQFIAKA